MGKYANRVCQNCGEEYWGEGNICSICKRAETRMLCLSRYSLEKEMQELKKQDEANRQTVREADELGLTYGQYQALKFMGRL